MSMRKEVRGDLMGRFVEREETWEELLSREIIGVMDVYVDRSKLS